MRRKTTYGDVSPLAPDLSDVPGEHAETVQDLFDTWANVRARNRVLRDYYEMKQQVENLQVLRKLLGPEDHIRRPALA